MKNVATIPQQSSLVPEAEVGMLAMLERVALNPDVTADKLERLLAIQERVMAKRAEDEFNSAMSLAQSEMGRISADAENPQTRSKYASYGQMDRVLRPIYTRHGFSLSFDEADSPKADHIRALCHVSHRGGHTRLYHRDMPVSTTGLAGKANMTQTHGNASAESYAHRYLVKGIFNVAIGQDDNDGNDYERITEGQAADLDALIDEVKADRAKFLEYMQLGKVEDMPAKAYKTAVAALRQKAKKAQ